MRRVNLALSAQQLARLKRLSPVKRRQWARPVIEPAIELLLAVGDIGLIRQFTALGPDVIRATMKETIAAQKAQRKGDKR